MSLLSDKIANQRLTMDAQNKVHSLDEFRSTVNYVNTTNKGYVRFTTKGGNGGLAIEKFNNVIDMHGATLAVDAETNRFELSQYAFLADLDADSFVAMIESFAASLVDMRKKIEGAKILKLFAPRSGEWRGSDAR